MSRAAARRLPRARPGFGLLAAAGLLLPAVGLFLPAVGLLFPAVGHAQSFDCAKAARPTERIICANPDLARADTTLGIVYKDVHDAVPAARRKAMYRDEIAWLRARETVCGMPRKGTLPPAVRAEKARCLLRETRARIETLERYYRTATGHAHRLAGQTEPSRPTTRAPGMTDTQRLDDTLQ